jgi:hypothetical protein
MTTRRTRRVTAIGLAALAAIGLAAGCSATYSAERDGKELGESICDAKEASSASDKKSAVSDAVDQLESIATDYASVTSNQKQAISENLSAIGQNIENGDTAAINGNIAALQDTLSNVGSGASAVTQAVVDGVNEGLSGCTD